MGIVLANFWEWLYNDEEWKHPVGMVERLLEKAKKDFSRLLISKFVDYRLAPPRDEMWDVIEAGIRGYIKTMKATSCSAPMPGRRWISPAMWTSGRPSVGGLT